MFVSLDITFWNSKHDRVKIFLSTSWGMFSVMAFLYSLSFLQRHCLKPLKLSKWWVSDLYEISNYHSVVWQIFCLFWRCRSVRNLKLGGSQPLLAKINSSGTRRKECGEEPRGLSSEDPKALTGSLACCKEQAQPTATLPPELRWGRPGSDLKLLD